MRRWTDSPARRCGDDDRDDTADHRRAQPDFARAAFAALVVLVFGYPCALGMRSYAKTKQNLALAFAFNGIGIHAAATGLVHPIWAMPRWSPR